MRKFLLVIMLFLPCMVFANAGEHACGTIECDSFKPALNDHASLQRGAKYFVNYCMGCHSLAYMRYERLADDLGISHEDMQANLNFLAPGRKIGELMSISAPKKNQKKWFGAAPPDLTLVSRARGSAWIYTYMRNFYRDDNRPYGVNNKVFPDVGMPHMMLELQGMQECAPGAIEGEYGIKRDPLTNKDILIDEQTGKYGNPCGKYSIKQPGSMSVAEYDQAVFDLTNFLTYVGEPVQMKRQRLGVYVLLFVALFFVLAWLLNREYWKNIH